jgi:hypothetical protein
MNNGDAISVVLISFHRLLVLVKLCHGKSLWTASIALTTAETKLPAAAKFSIKVLVALIFLFMRRFLLYSKIDVVRV